jgi:hypothetical protein
MCAKSSSCIRFPTFLFQTEDARILSCSNLQVIAQHHCSHTLLSQVKEAPTLQMKEAFDPSASVAATPPETENNNIMGDVLAERDAISSQRQCTCPADIPAERDSHHPCMCPASYPPRQTQFWFFFSSSPPWQFLFFFLQGMV